VPERFPFPRTARILNKKEYSRILSQGEKIWGRFFLCFVLMDTALETRLGLVASRKVGSAVARNRVKRLLREFFRRSRRRLPQGTQLVVVARASSTSLDGNACIVELERMLSRRLSDA
jgi:ribonuclease P protein component